MHTLSASRPERSLWQRRAPALPDRRDARPVLGPGRAAAPRVPSLRGARHGLLARRARPDAASGGAAPAGAAVRLPPPPSPRYAFGYREPPVSGNAINGLGETQRSRARQVFHSSGGEPLAWKALDDFFSVINPWRVVRHVIANTWQLRRSDGPVRAARREVADPRAMADEIKAAGPPAGRDARGRRGGDGGGPLRGARSRPAPRDLPGPAHGSRRDAARARSRARRPR